MAVLVVGTLHDEVAGFAIAMSDGPATVIGMTASAPREHPDDRSLALGASPAAIHSGLFPEDREAFLAAYDAALEKARSTLHLAPVNDVLEEWRRRAVLQSDPDAFRRAVRRAAELITGEPVPNDEPFEITRAHAGM